MKTASVRAAGGVVAATLDFNPNRLLPQLTIAKIAPESFFRHVAMNGSSLSRCAANRR
jgi:hypothetical protein